MGTEGTSRTWKTREVEGEVAVRPLPHVPDVEFLDRESEVARNRWWRFRTDVAAHDLPYDPPPTREQTIWWLYADPGDRRETWVIRDADGIAAAVNLLFFDGSNPHLVWATDLHVRPDVRRSGYGRALYEHARRRAQDEGRRTLNISGPRSEAASEFADALGLDLTQTLLRSVQRLDAIDLARLERSAARSSRDAPQYSVVRWVGHCPDEHINDYVHAKNGMLDAPVAEGIEFTPPVAKAEIVREAEDLRARVGVREYVVCARDDTTGEFAAVTQVFALGGARGEQGDTTVLRHHRGHRLGLRLKVTMLRWLTEVEPGIRELETLNDPNNEPMLRVNRQLGYRPSELWDTWTTRVIT